MGKLVDRIPRRRVPPRSAPARLPVAGRHRRLFHDKTLEDGFLEITRVANDEIIDYGNLSSFERNIARRVIFFYLWVKGATLYGARAVGEYPVKLAVIAQLAKETAEKQRADLGPVPSYAESLMRVGGTDDRPNVINPASAGILGQTYSTLGQVASLAGGDFGAANEPWNALTPGWGWGSTCCRGTTRSPGRTSTVATGAPGSNRPPAAGPGSAVRAANAGPVRPAVPDERPAGDPRLPVRRAGGAPGEPLEVEPAGQGRPLVNPAITREIFRVADEVGLPPHPVLTRQGRIWREPARAHRPARSG